MTIEKTHTNLKTAVYITIFTAFVFIFLFSFIGINDRRYAYEDSKSLAKETSRKAAIETEIYFSSALMVARSIEQKSRIIREAGLSRNKIVEILKNALVRYPNFLAVWTMWAPNAFDKSDIRFKGDTLYDENGSLCVCFIKYNNKLLYGKNNTKDYYNDYYTIPKKNLSELFTEPFHYQYHGHPYQFYETSVVVPIVEDSSFLGVVGIDINLENLKKKLNSVKLYKSGYLSLISNNGVIISHTDTSFIEKNIFNIVNEKDSSTYKTIKNGQELSLETNSEFKKQKVFRFFYPIKVGNSNSPWSMMVEIPINEATTRSNQLLLIAFVTLFLGISLLIYLVINILDRKQYEKTLLEAIQKAQESDELKTAFLNNMSHEIRTPLNGIIGFSELLTNTETSKESRQNFNEIIKSSCYQLLSLISNALELSKIQNGNVAIDLSDVSVAKSINVVIQTYEKSAKDKGLMISRRFPKNSSNIVCKTDEGKLHQALSNLISNAIKFTNIGFIEIGFEENESTLKFFVKDTGIGISPTDSKNMYKIFSRGDSVLNKKYGGVGIGLSITKAFIDLLGGNLWFDSEVSRGTTFYFTLPYIKHQDIITNENNISDKNNLSNNIKILVAEDEKSSFLLIRELLKSTNVELLWAKSGTEAVDVCHVDESIKLVLMDIKMPGMNGYEATKLIKSQRKDLPVVAISAFIQNNDPDQQILFDSILTKPIKTEEFLSTIIKYT